MRTLDFINGTHYRGLNVTVRKGYKWADVKIGEEVLLTTEGIPNEGICKAVIRMIQIKPFNLISNRDIVLEHDPLCTTLNGLLPAMQRAYPDFKEDDVCTLLTYEPLK